MKPTEKQKLICELIISHLNNWKSTNDLSSPTHQSDIDEEVNSLERHDEIDYRTSREIKSISYDLLAFIRGV